MMTHKWKSLVFDSWSILAFLEDEPSGKLIADMLGEAQEEKIPMMITVVNAGEVWYILARQTSEADADKTIAELQEIGIEFIGVDWKLTRQAAQFKSKYRMSYGDCYAAALAKERKGDLVTGDREFKQVEKEIRIYWLKQEKEG